MPAAAELSLDQLYGHAARVTARGSKSFYFATRFFPPDLARAAHAVYWFCRYTDDLADECATPADGRRHIEAWARALCAAESGHTATHPVLKVFLDTAARHRIPLQYAHELIEGMRMDLGRNRYPDFETLQRFCYRVASVVGLMMCWVIGFESERERARALPHAIDLGIAMQLTNILRDVGEDRARGRIYLPQEDLARFGYSEQELIAGVRNQAFRALMRFEADRARQFYKQGNAGIALLLPRGRFAVKIASDVYGDILRRIELSDFDVFQQRAVVPRGRKYWLAARNLAWPALRLTASRVALWSAQ